MVSMVDVVICVSQESLSLGKGRKTGQIAGENIYER